MVHKPHRTGTREEWQRARDEIAKLEAEQAKRNEEIKAKRLELPWVPVETRSIPGTAARRSPSSSTAAPSFSRAGNSSSFRGCP
jgi:predicted dithiol-disulfide oxidoreductase (DUF899 family)